MPKILKKESGLARGMNYIQLKSKNPLACEFAYFDNEQLFADQIFIQKKIHVQFGAEFAKQEFKYRLIFCKIKKQDKDKFLEAMEDLEKKMLLCGYPDYKEYCQDFMKIFPQNN